MKTGNKQQAIVLSVVAVGALGFLGLQVKGIAARNAVQPLANQPAATGPAKATAGVDRDLPRTLFSDPFSHPALPRTVTASTEPTAQVQTAKLPTQKLPQLPGHIELTPLRPDAAQIEAGAEDRSAPRAASGPTLCLQAVISSPQAVAFVSIDGKDPQKVTAGQTIFSGLAVTSITDGAIEVRFAKGTRRLRVGETIQL